MYKIYQELYREYRGNNVPVAVKAVLLWFSIRIAGMYVQETLSPSISRFKVYFGNKSKMFETKL